MIFFKIPFLFLFHESLFGVNGFGFQLMAFLIERDEMETYIFLFVKRRNHLDFQGKKKKKKKIKILKKKKKKKKNHTIHLELEL